jgi:hypothetical protein
MEHSPSPESNAGRLSASHKKVPVFIESEGSLQFYFFQMNPPVDPMDPIPTNLMLRFTK